MQPDESPLTYATNLAVRYLKLRSSGIESQNKLFIVYDGANEMDEVEIVDYDPRWPLMFEREAEILREILDQSLIVGLVHFGSTAIVGLSAKPIIDILIAVHSLTCAKATFVEKLGSLEYVYWSENPRPDRLFFVKGMPPFGLKRSHHVHVTLPDGEMWRRLKFRDYLRAHPNEALVYERLKRQLAIDHRTDRDAYTDAKSAYVESIMRKAELISGLATLP